MPAIDLFGNVIAGTTVVMYAAAALYHLWQRRCSGRTEETGGEK